MRRFFRSAESFPTGEDAELANWAVELIQRDRAAYEGNRIVGEMIKLARIDEGLSREEFAGRLGPPFSQAVLLAIESGTDLKRLKEEKGADIWRVTTELGFGDRVKFRKLYERARGTIGEEDKFFEEFVPKERQAE